MQFFRQAEAAISTVVGWDLRILILTPAKHAAESTVAVRIAGLGGAIEVVNEVFAALDTLMFEDMRFGLFVIECDEFGGIEACRKLVSMLHKGGVCIPILWVSSDCVEQEFPQAINAPVLLRAPVSAVSMRVGFEHAMRNRLRFQAA